MTTLFDEENFSERGFLPVPDPVLEFPYDSPYRLLDEWGRELPERLTRADFRQSARQFRVPAWQDAVSADTLPQLRLYYLRLGFLASGYINQVGQDPAHVLPANIARPRYNACSLLGRPPILSYDDYALYNWRRMDPEGPIALGNIDTLQNFVQLYDEHWFILVHVHIEALAGRILGAILDLVKRKHFDDPDRINAAITVISETIEKQIQVLRRIPEQMSPDLYFNTFRPYIRFFEDVVYEGLDRAPINFRGETGAQSSVMPSLVAFFKIPHQPTALMDHLSDMRGYMPANHRALIERIAALPPVRPLADREVFNTALEAIARFREVHYEWARRYIDDKVDDPLGTGGTPYMQWLAQLIRETRNFRK